MYIHVYYAYMYIHIDIYICMYLHMGVSRNGRSPKSSKLETFSIETYCFGDPPN